jgi:hypothetical protein
MEIPRLPDPYRGGVVPAGSEPLDSAGAESPAPLAAPELSGPSRALFGFVAIAMAFCVVMLVLSGGWTSFLLAAGAACVAGTMGYCAVTGREPASSRQFSLSPRFHELADPARPLTAGDPIPATPRHASIQPSSSPGPDQVEEPPSGR